MATAPAPGILARGPWSLDAVRAAWREDLYDAPAEKEAAADAAIAALKERGSPSHDGEAARFVSHRAEPDGSLHVELQRIRWGLRLVEGDASGSLSATCAVRDPAGRWLAGRRASWLSSWAGRWALGAGGAVDVGETPADTLTRELAEEWGVVAEHVRGEALVRLPQNMVMFVGQAWLAEGAVLDMDPEHDAHAWWPADPDDWPPEADDALRLMARLIA